MKNMLTISIVVYKGYDDAFNAVSSIEKFTSKSISKKLYVIDNSSDATSADEKASFAKKLASFVDVEYLDTQQNLGFGGGHNYIIDMIESKYHAIVNPDILLKSDAFKVLLNFMEKGPSIGMCIPKIVGEDGEIQPVYRHELTVSDMFIRMFLSGFFKKRQDHHTMQYKDYSKPFRVPFGQGSFLVIRTELFKQLGGFDDGYFMYVEDADLCKSVNKVSKLVYCPYTEVIHKWEKGSHKNKKLLIAHIRSMIYYFRKWGIKIV